MVVCKFFLQGTCKFGSNCKFEHQITSADAGSSVSILRQNSQPIASTTHADVNTLIRSVQSDMENIEKGHQWLLSSYTPFKEKPQFPGFEDKSFEEVRFGFYEAGKNGTLEQYKQQLQQCLQDAMMKVIALKDPSPDIVMLLKQIYNTPVNSAFGTTQSPQYPSNSVFSGQNPSNSIFNATKPASPFGAAPAFPANTNSIFGGQANFNQPTNTPFTATNSPFGGQQTGNSPFSGQTSNNPFGGQQTNSPFTGQTAGGNSPFAQQPATNSPFANQAATFVQPAVVNSNTNTPFIGQSSGNSIFGGQANFTQPFQGNIFQEAKPTVYSTPFNNPSTNIFQTTQSAPFQAPTAPFQSAQTPAAPFQSNTPFQSSTTPFQTSQSNSPFNQNYNQQTNFNQQQPFVSGTPLNIPQPNSIFGGNNYGNKPPQVCNEALYSKGEELTQDDIIAFQADSFEFGKIPVKPPPIQLCF